MDLPELLLWLFIAGCVAVGLAFGLWLLFPVALLAWVMLPAAEKVSNDVRDTSAPGSYGALWAGVLTIVGAGVVVLLALVVAGGAI